MATRVASSALLLSLLLAACSGEDSTPPDPGLIVNAGFQPAANATRPANWGVSQHAGERSYEVTTADGVLVIRKTGEEPWGLVNQTLDVSHLAGRELAFSMELSGELTEPQRGALEPSGLVVRIKGLGPSDSPLTGKRHLLTMTQEPGLSAGNHGWSRHSLRFQVPEGRHLDLAVGVQMTLDGELRARAPQLLVLDQASP